MDKETFNIQSESLKKAGETARIGGYWTQVVNHFLTIEEQFMLLDDVSANDLASSAQFSITSAIGLSGLLTAFSLKKLNEKEKLSSHEKIVQKALIADLTAQLTAVSTNLTLIFGSEKAQSFLMSSDALTGVGASIAGNLFIVIQLVFVGSNIVKALSAQRELGNHKILRDEHIKSWLDANTYNQYSKLNEDDKSLLIKSILSNDASSISSDKLKILANTFREELGNNASISGQLFDDYLKIHNLRFERNGSVQTALYFAGLVSVTIAMLAFPPSAIIVSSVAILSFTLKFAWDFYRVYHNNQVKKELKANNTQRLNKDEQLNKTAVIHDKAYLLETKNKAAEPPVHTQKNASNISTQSRDSFFAKKEKWQNFANAINNNEALTSSRSESSIKAPLVDDDEFKNIHFSFAR